MSKLKRPYENAILVAFLLPLIYFFHKPSSFFNDNVLVILFVFGAIISALGLFTRVWARHFKANTHGELAEEGLYGYTRNPMYLASFFIGLGLSFAVGNLWLILGYSFVFILMHNLIIFREEKFLKAHYGQPYIDYMSRVPRWFPKLSRKVKFSINSDTDISLKNIFNAFIKEGNPLFGNTLLFMIVGFTNHFRDGFLFSTVEYTAFGAVICLWVTSESVLAVIKHKNKKEAKAA